MSPDNIYEDVELLKKAVWGNRENPKDFPGVIAEMRLIGVMQERTNEILTELSDSVRWIARLVIGSVALGLMGALLKISGTI